MKSNIYFFLIEIYSFRFSIRYLRVDIGFLFIYCEFMIDCHLLQRTDNVTYKCHIFIIIVCHNEEIILSICT